MIANKPVRFCISLIHLSIALFCFAFCIGFTLTNENGSLHNLISSGDFSPILVCFFTGLSAFISFATWQRDDFSLSKRLTYLTAFLILIEYITILISEVDKFEKLLIVSMLFVTPLIFVFLLGFSQVGNSFFLQKNDIETLDASFLQEEYEIKKDFFWKINRIVAITFFVFCFFLAVNMLEMEVDTFLTILSLFFIILLIGSFLLFISPKIGSYVFAALCIIIGIGVFSALLFSFFIKDTIDPNKIIFGTSCVFCLSFFFFTIAMLLLSKEAKEEWKDKLENQ